MALKALVLRKKIDVKKKELEALRSVDFATREAELEAAIAEAETEEDQRTVEEEIEKFNTEKSENAEQVTLLEKEIEELEADLEAEEREQAVPAPEKKEVRKEMGKFGITSETMQERGVQEFISEIRAAAKEKRALTNVGLTIPDVFLGIVKENVVNYSKLYRHAFTRSIKGEGKLTIMGTIPEAVWTACCANINEVDLGFAQVTVDCNKVAAFIPVCDAILDDSDVNLASEFTEDLTIAIGKALDKAILYGTGSGMPLGIYTRLAQTSQPGSYPSTARPWVDLHSTNMLTISNSVTGLSLFQTIMLDSAVMSGKYSRGNVVWCMNETTLNFLKAQGMSVNAAGAIVSAVDGTMPGVGGTVETFDFIPDYNIIGGYFDCYLLAERQGITLDSSNIPKYIEDETLFRARARYDGQPVIAEAFLALAINGASLATVSFVDDTANTAAYIILNKSAVTLASTTGKEQLKARVLNGNGNEVKDAAITWTSSAAGKATVSNSGLVQGVASGSTVITATSGSAVAVCNVTVPS